MSNPIRMTAAAHAVGFSLIDVTAIATHAANLLQEDGPTAAHLVQAIVKAAGALAGRNVTGIIAALDDAEPDVTQIVADLRAEFGLSA